MKKTFLYNVQFHLFLSYLICDLWFMRQVLAESIKKKLDKQFKHQGSKFARKLHHYKAKLSLASLEQQPLLNTDGRLLVNVGPASASQVLAVCPALLALVRPLMATFETIHHVE